MLTSPHLSLMDSGGSGLAWGNPEEALEELQGVGSTQPLTHLGRLCPDYLSCWAKGQELKEHAVPLFLPSLGPKSVAGLELGTRTPGLLGVPFEIWVLYLLFHIGSWKGKPIPAWHCCLTWLIRSYNPAVEILGLTQNNRDQEYCG